LSSAAVFGRGQAFLGNGMQPEVVARTLSKVEDEWKAQAAVFAECDSTKNLAGATIVNCADAPTSFGKSCNTVVNAIIQGSGGDKDTAKEYMTDVCSQKSISGWHQAQCHSLAVAVRTSMSADSYSNRMAFDSAKLCTGFWSGFLDGEKQRMAKEEVERVAAEKKAADEAAEQEKQLEESKKKEAEHKKVEEANRVKEEAAAKAEEAAAKLAQKQAEAEASQQAAKQKKEEAGLAEGEASKAKEALEKEEDKKAIAAVEADEDKKAIKAVEADEDWKAIQMVTADEDKTAIAEVKADEAKKAAAAPVVKSAK